MKTLIDSVHGPAKSPKLDSKHFLKFGPELAQSSLFSLAECYKDLKLVLMFLSDEADNHFSLVICVKCGCSCALHKTCVPKFLLNLASKLKIQLWIF